MTLTRRETLALLAGSLAASVGPFEPTRESLKRYQVPEWFRDAKFGIWAHWGPQSAAEAGDWYARNMYIQGSEQYKHHVANYGHPSKFGFKDIIPTWRGDKFDADHLVGLYKKAGAKYFVSMGVHHDNFDPWNSRHTPWNSVNRGPRKDIVGMFRQAAQREGLKFGVSEHLWISYKWFAVSHDSDQTGPLAGVPYDGQDPANAALYHEAGCARFATGDLQWGPEGIPFSWRQHWLARITDLLLNFPLPNSGELDAQERSILEEITAWMAVNSEGIHGSRPWKVFGEGPGTQVKTQATFNEAARQDLTAEDIRFTTKGSTVYAFVMGWPPEAVIRSVTEPVENVELLGYRGGMRWSQGQAGLRVPMPSVQPSNHAVTLKITFS